MKTPDITKVKELEELPNIGKAIAEKLRLIGIYKPQQLIGADPIKMYDALCMKKMVKIDLCVLDVFMAAVEFMEGGAAKPWWKFTTKRKQTYHN